MWTPVPIYKSPAETFEADLCQPLVSAVERKEVRLEALARGHYPGRRLPPNELSGLKTIGYWSAVGRQTWGLPWHRNEGIEITYLESGNVVFASEGFEELLSAGVVTITRPWQKHRVGNPTVAPGKLHWLILDVNVRRPNQDWEWPAWCMLSKRDLQELEITLRQTEQTVWRTSADLRRCFQKLSGAVEVNDHGSRTSALAIRVNELLLLILEMLRKNSLNLDQALTGTERTVRLFLDDLRDHPEHLTLDWTVEEMAHSCGLGITQFTHVVKYLTNRTPLNYLNDCRLDHSVKLLSSPTAPTILDVAHDCGFSSSQYFATVFRRKYGCAPSEFRMSSDSAPNP